MPKRKYKVPGRMVFCDSLRIWMAMTIYCWVVLRLHPKFRRGEKPFHGLSFNEE